MPKSSVTDGSLQILRIKATSISGVDRVRRVSSWPMAIKGKIAIAAAVLFLAYGAHAQQRSVDDFFRDFTADWIRGNPNLATSSRYFTGEEQDRLERQLTPQTDAY